MLTAALCWHAFFLKLQLYNTGGKVVDLQDGTRNAEEVAQAAPIDTGTAGHNTPAGQPAGNVGSAVKPADVAAAGESYCPLAQS